MKRNIKTQQGSLCLFLVSKVLPVIRSSFKTVITIFIIIFTLSFGTSCKHRMNIKEFIERELAKDRSNTIVLYDTSATGYNNTVYVPSMKEITGTVNIKNEYNVGYTAVLTLDNPAQKKCFVGDEPPKVTVTETGEFQFTFRFKAIADARGDEDNTDGKGAMVPVTVKLIKKEGGALFAEKRFTIRCNTPPAPPSLDVEKDVYTITKPADTDFAKCETTFYYGTDNKKASDWSCSDETAKRRGKEYMHDAHTSIKEANGARKLVAYALDSAGLKSKPFEIASNYSYSSDTKFKVTTQETGIGNPTEITWLIGTGNVPQGTKIDYPYRLANSSFTITMKLADGATAAYGGIQYSNGNNTLATVISDNPNFGNKKSFDFTVTAEDEETSKTYKLVLGRQDGFKVTVDHSGASSPCDIKVNKFNNGMVAISGAVAFVHASDLNDGKLKVQIASKSGANLVKSIQAKIDQSDASDPPATANFYGTNTIGATKDIYGYSFELPMVQAQTLTIGYDNTISFDGNGEATIPGPPDIKIKVKDGELTIPSQYNTSSTENYPDTETIDLNTNPVLKMISIIEGGYDSGEGKYRGPFKSTTVKKIILPQGLKSLAREGMFHGLLLPNLEEIVFPNGFDGYLDSLGPWYMNGKMKTISITGSKRYFNNEFNYLIERQKDGSGNYSNDNCILKYAVVETADSVKYNDTYNSEPLQNSSQTPPVYCLVIKNGKDDMGNAYEITALSDPSTSVANIVFDCPTLRIIGGNVCTSNKRLKNIYIVQDMPNLRVIADNSFKNTDNLQNVYVSDSISEERFNALRDKLTENGHLRVDQFKRETFTISY